MTTSSQIAMERILQMVNDLEDRMEASSNIPVPFVYHSEIKPPSGQGWNQDEFGDFDLSDDLVSLWGRSSGVVLFREINYGAFGIEICTPSEALGETYRVIKQQPSDFIKGDLIAGKFYADERLILVRCDKEASDFGQVIIVEPTDSRKNWPIAASSLSEFLLSYIESFGERFW